MLEVKKLTFSYGGVKALRGLSFSVKKGESVAIIGPNGAGKSTLFACLTASKKGVKGRVLLNGHDVLHLPTHAICQRGISRTFQYPKVFNGLTVLEHVMVGAFNQKRCVDFAKQHGFETLEQVELAHRAYEEVGSLSLFERKRLEVAKVVATGASVILLDEVMSGTRVEEMPMMVRLCNQLVNTGKTLLFVEHIMPFVYQVARRVLVLENGSLVADGLPKETLSLPLVKRIYFGGGDHA